jgi:hypothetical protein
MSRSDRERRSERRRRRDEIAASAARSWSRGAFESIDRAIDDALGQSDGSKSGYAASSAPRSLPEADRPSALEGERPPRPTEGRVRLHLRALAESALGREAYLGRVADVLEHAAVAMGLFSAPPVSARATLAGRAARGQIEGDCRLHLRVETEVAIGVLAAALVDHGFDEPSFDSFDARSASSRCGRLHRLATGRDDVELVVVRCPPRQVVPGGFDLVRGRPTSTLDLESLIERIRRLRKGEDPF